MDKIRILMLEDNPADAELTERSLRRAGIGFTAKRVDTRESFEREIKAFNPDLILADYSLPGFNAMEALLILECNGMAYLPFIIVTETLKEEAAMKCVESGAWDYVIKGHPVRLPLAVRSAMARRESEKKRDAALARIEKLNQAMLDFGSDPDENINRLVKVAGEAMGAACALYNRLEAGMLCSKGTWNTPSDYDPKDKPDGHICYDVIKRGQDDVLVIRDLPSTVYAGTDRNVAKYGLKTYVGKAVKLRGGYIGSVCVVYQTDVTVSEEDKKLMGIIAAAIAVEEDRKLTTVELKDESEKFRIIFEFAPDACYLVDNKGVFVDGNRNAERLIGRKKEEMIGRSMVESGLLPIEQIPRALALFAKNLKGLPTGPDEFTLIRRDGLYVEVEISTHPVRIKGKEHILGIARDVTERRKAREKLLSTIEELKHYKEITVNREHKMVEIKKEVNRLSKELGRQEPYDKLFTE